MIQWLPSLNAILNATSGVLLILGVIFISRGNAHLHRRCMIMAFIVSSLFLISYLTYHGIVGHTVFNPGVPGIRTLYLFILWTHIPLAGLVPVLAIRLFYLASKRRFKSHAALARWAFPIWMYVSITGVVIYFMLYHWFPGA
jgi:putative membrane protein